MLLMLFESATFILSMLFMLFILFMLLVLFILYHHHHPPLLPPLLDDLRVSDDVQVQLVLETSFSGLWTTVYGLPH